MRNEVGVSIVIPSYNSGIKLIDAVRSCSEHQELKLLEIIVVDDASENECEELLFQHFSDLLHRSVLRIIRHKKNQGTFAARKTGILNAKGKYILFLDADDQLEKNSISYLYFQLENSDADICFFGVKSSRGKRGFLRKLPKNNSNQVLKDFILDLSTPPWGIGGKIILTSLLKDAVEQLCFIQEEKFLLAEDAILLFVSAVLAKKSISVDKFFYIYNDNMSSITKDNSKIDFRDKQLILAIYFFSKLNRCVTLRKYPYFFKANQKAIHILKSHRVFNKRFFKASYAQACYKSYLFSNDIRYLLMLILNIISLGAYKR